MLYNNSGSHWDISKTVKSTITVTALTSQGPVSVYAIAQDGLTPVFLPPDS